MKRFRVPLLLLGGIVALVLGDRRFGSSSGKSRV